MTLRQMLALSLAMAMSAGAALAQDEPKPAPTPSATPVPTHFASTPAPLPVADKASAGGTLQLTLYLVLLLGLFAGGAYLLRNGFAIFQPKLKGERKLQISETRILGNRQFLIVAEYESRKILLGVCPGRIDYLCSLAGAEPEFPKIAPENSDA